MTSLLKFSPFPCLALFRISPPLNRTCPSFVLIPCLTKFARHVMLHSAAHISVISDFISQSSHFTLFPSNPQTQHLFTDSLLSLHSAIRLFSMFLMLFLCPHPSYLHSYLFTTFHLFSFPLLLSFLLFFFSPVTMNQL